MKSPCAWQFDEFNPPGRDYGSQAEVDVYQPSHATFRDLAAESNSALDAIGIRPGDVLIEFGSGPGVFAIEAARRGTKVHAVDVSAAMIRQARMNAAVAGVRGIEFHHAGFLSYSHPDRSADAVATTYALHHLPDLWKGVALSRMRGMLKRGGRLYIRDVILEPEDILGNIQAFVDRQASVGGDFLRDDAEGHFRDEFSTYDWIMEGLITRAGFRILERHVDVGVIGTYLCRRT